MTLQFYRISFCVLYVQGGWAVLSLEGPCVCMSRISVKNSWASCSPGHRLQITVKHRPTVVKMKGRSGGKDHMIQSAADILGKVHKLGGWGGIVYHFWPRIGGQNSSSSKGDSHLQSPPNSFFTYNSAGTPILASKTSSKLIYKLRPPTPHPRKGVAGGFVYLPTHVFGKQIRQILVNIVFFIS